jgi:hypothetical protein
VLPYAQVVLSVFLLLREDMPTHPGLMRVCWVTVADLNRFPKGKKTLHRYANKLLDVNWLGQQNRGYFFEHDKKVKQAK